MKAKCIADIACFTLNKVYNVVEIDEDGDIWVKADDDGDRSFMFADECEVFNG